MASISSIPRFLLPRQATLPKSRLLLLDLPKRTTTPARAPGLAVERFQHASTSSSSSKARVLQKPSKFNPPSHPQRIRRKPVMQYGPDLTEQELETQRTKKYPHMMPPEGSFMHWFLTNKILHMWISLSILTSLTVFTLTTNFRRTSPYVDLLPAPSSFFWHPISSTGQALDVLKMHVEHTSAETAERRKRKLEEVQKRKAYRIAHGLEKADAQGMRLDDPEAARVAIQGRDGQGSATYTDFEGKKRPIKKWLGIW